MIEGRKLSPSVATIWDWWEILPPSKGVPSSQFPEAKLPSRADMINRGQDLNWWLESERCEQARLAETAPEQQWVLIHNIPSPVEATVDTPMRQEESDQSRKAPELLLILVDSSTHCHMTQHEFLTGPAVHLVNALHGFGFHVIASGRHHHDAADSGTSGSGVAAVQASSSTPSHGFRNQGDLTC